MKKIPFISFEINLFLILYHISSFIVSLFFCAKSVETDRIILALEEA